MKSAHLDSAEGNDCRKYCMINLHEKILPTLQGSNPHPQPPDHKSNAHPTEPPKQAQRARERERERERDRERERERDLK